MMAHTKYLQICETSGACPKSECSVCSLNASQTESAAKTNAAPTIQSDGTKPDGPQAYSFQVFPAHQRNDDNDREGSPVEKTLQRVRRPDNGEDKSVGRHNLEKVTPWLRNAPLTPGAI